MRFQAKLHGFADRTEVDGNSASRFREEHASAQRLACGASCLISRQLSHCGGCEGNNFNQAQVIRMIRSIPRRRVLSWLLAVPGSAALAVACSEADTAAQDASGEAPEASGTVDTEALMEPGPLPEMALGEEDAPVTIIEYASMTCSHCANFHTNTFPELEEKYIESGQVRFIMREFPFDPRAEAGFMLARCTDDKYFPMVDVLFQRQQSWARAENGQQAMLQIARVGGFSQESFEACLTDQELLDDVRAVRTRAAEEFDVEATPTFFINGSKYSGAMSIDQMSAIIDSML